MSSLPVIILAGGLATRLRPMTERIPKALLEVAGRPFLEHQIELLKRNGIVEIAGPERARLNEIVARYLKAVGDPRKVVRDPGARYFGGQVEERSLVPLGEARLGRIGFDEWFRRSQAAA